MIVWGWEGVKLIQWASPLARISREFKTEHPQVTGSNLAEAGQAGD
jgi:hypothetical protein